MFLDREKVINLCVVTAEQSGHFNTTCLKCAEKSKEKASCTSVSQGSDTAVVCFQQLQYLSKENAVICLVSAYLS